MIIDEDVYLAHYGTPRRSGRYPWGSGENPYQDNKKFITMIADLRKKGMSDPDIARGFGMTTTQFRAVNSMAKNENKQADINMALRLHDKGLSNVAIGKRMDIRESSVRSLLAPGAKDKAQVLDATANMLKDEVAKKGYIDIGVGVEHYSNVGVSKTKLDIAVAKLKEEGYKVDSVKIKQLGTGHFTKVMVLSKPGTTYSEVLKNKNNIQQISSYSKDSGHTFLGIDPPTSIDSKRVAVNYAEDGGTEADGVIYVRPGVDDISLGKSSYAQVRIAVDDTHFLKGMAIYKKDLPAGVDLVFNTNKSKTDAPNKLDTMKGMKRDKDGNIDPDNPFGATITRQNGVMNVLSEEGTWKDWSRSLSSQVLSKQSPLLAKTQLDMTFEKKTNELKQILSLSNPAIRRTLLEAFSDGADSSAVHLEAAYLPRQGSHVILPVSSMKTTEIYAPNFRDGERVVLIRYPHGGTFEIPELTVNNRNREAKSLLGTNAPDAVGINSKVAERLSGADFDGDTVLVIPNTSGKIKTTPALEKLRNFDTKRAYPAYEGMPEITSQNKQTQMGLVSNLITDMTIRGAPADEIARAVKHSMVVIDSENHNLNYKQSAIDNNIPQLKEKYQGGKRAGASTLISRAGSKVYPDNRKPRPAAEGGPIDKATGKLVYVPTGETYTDKKGKLVTKTFRTKRLAVTDDAFELSSGTPTEEVYATHSNKLKDLANTARKEMVATKNIPYSPSAKAAYSDEVVSLNAKLNIALENAPRERQAHIIGNAVVSMKEQANPNMSYDELKKIRNQALAAARTRTGANKTLVEITPSEWDAIQAGAISNNKLEEILRNSDLDEVKKLAMPRTAPTMSTAMLNRAKSMSASGYTQADIADQLGVSASTITTVLSEEGG